MPLDLAPLTAPVSREDVRAHVDAVRRERRVRPVPIGATVTTWLAVPALGALGVVVAPHAFRLLREAVADPDTASIAAAAILWGVMLGALGAAAWMLWRWIDAITGTGARWLRLHRFARANALVFDPSPRAGLDLGLLSAAGEHGVAGPILRADEGSRAGFEQVGDYRYTIDLGRFERTVRWGYAIIRLGTRLPHLVLDGRRNDRVIGSNPYAVIARGQRLRLGAEFDREFTLSCPEGYETEALRLFTPDIMARFVDRVAACDVEIVDDRLIIAVKGGLVTDDPAVWAWIDETVAAIVDRVDRWERWRDERLGGERTMQAAPSVAPGARLLRPPKGVAAGGRRLRRRVPWLVVAGGLLTIAATIATMIDAAT